MFYCLSVEEIKQNCMLAEDETTLSGSKPTTVLRLLLRYNDTHIIIYYVGGAKIGHDPRPPFKNLYTFMLY